LAVVMPFGQLRLTANGYRISGGAISLSGGIIADLPSVAGQSDTQIELPITLAADQTFAHTTVSYSLILSGPLSLDAHHLTVQTAGNVSFAGPVSGSGGLVVTGSGRLILTAANTFTGTTTVVGAGTTVATIQVDGTVGPVVLNGGELKGSGTTGSVTAAP